MRMKFNTFMGLVAALLLVAMNARAGALPSAPQFGDTYEITLTKDSVKQGSNKSSGSSHDQTLLLNG